MMGFRVAIDGMGGQTVERLEALGVSDDEPSPGLKVREEGCVVSLQAHRESCELWERLWCT